MVELVYLFACMSISAGIGISEKKERKDGHPAVRQSQSRVWFEEIPNYPQTD